ncbi:MAG TPA: hypothetical protein VGM21_03295 [Actinomycetota bacterium]|jgi:hypothetical protein
MAITGPFRAGVAAAAALALAPALLAGCGGGKGPALAAQARPPARQAPVRTMQVEKSYQDPNGNRFAIEVAIGPIGDGGVCADLSPPDTYSHAMVLTVRSQTPRSRRVRLPRIAVMDRAVTFASTDSSGVACSTAVSTSNRTVLRGGQHKDFQALVSRRRDRAGDLVLTVWPQGQAPRELLRIPYRSLP